MQKFGKFICKYYKAILIIAIILLIPSLIGIKATKINYDILSYLPSDIETVEGQEILSEEFNMGAFAIVLVDDTMPHKDILKMEEKIKQIEGVEKVVSIADITGTMLPEQMIPNKIKENIIKENTTPMLVTFKTSIADEVTLGALDKMHEIVGEQCKISGVSAMINDTKTISNSEMSMYVIIAIILCILVLELALDSYSVPIILLSGIGISILYNMGSNIVLGEISYITKAIATVLQLGVTMDFSIFLYHSYQKQKKEFKDKHEAMSKAIAETLVSIVGSSLTTIAGFLALCSMDLTLGTDIGLVMAKGVAIGVICVVTVLPALMLALDKIMEKTKHKEILPSFSKTTKFVVKHYKIILVIFIILLIPAIYGNNNTQVYYNINKGLPDTLPGISANKDLADKFNMVSTQIALVDKNINHSKMQEITNKIEELDGVEWVISEDSLFSAGIPKEMLPESIKSVLESNKYKLVMINSIYETATDKANDLINEINSLLKSYDKNAIMAGEGPLMKDLVEIADHDFNSVNIASIGIIFILMIIVLKSISLPVILIGVIEFAIMLNMSISYYTGTTLPFVASIVIGTIQLGATVDYAILMTTKYINERKDGSSKKQAVENALGSSVKSIIVSALCFFAATCGVSFFSKIEMIGSICTLISRGAIISMVVVIFILPACLMLLDKLICKTTVGMRKCK